MLRRMKGFTLIELLIVVAIIAILAAIAVPNFLEAQTRSKVARVKADQRTLTIALETYYLDQNAYPAWDSSGTGGYGANNFGSNPAKPYRKIPTFRIRSGLADNLMTLTTPVSYVSSYFADPFAEAKGATFSYSPSKFGTGYLIWSYGPDSDENIVLGNNSTTGCGGDIIVSPGPPPSVSETVYNAENVVPSDNILQITYDPSNGTSSNGDVYRYKQ